MNSAQAAVLITFLAGIKCICDELGHSDGALSWISTAQSRERLSWSNKMHVARVSETASYG